jgi:SAM-dependent methyltransferase
MQPMSLVDHARRLYRRLPSPPSTNYSVVRSQAEFWRRFAPGSLVYDIGSKNQAELATDLVPAGTKLVSVDIDPAAKPDIVGDVHNLHMIADNSADGVFTSSVLEHVHDPWKAVAEIERILKPGGLVFIGLPFMFPFHGDPDDYWRVSHKGIDILCARFEKIGSGFSRGPASCTTHLLVCYLAMLFSFNSKRLYGVLFDLFKWLLFWNKYADRWLISHPMAHVIHAGVWFIGRKRGS